MRFGGLKGGLILVKTGLIDKMAPKGYCAASDTKLSCTNILLTF